MQRSNIYAGFISAFSRSIKGFTLIELLVVVIIIAVLAAVAMPMYRRAVLKSRFTTVMPMAKAVADAQEVYFLGNGQYALDKAELDITPVEANNTTVALSPTDGYDYVLAQRSDVPELHYIMYQKHSENYPGEIHCEAEKDNTEANRVCGELSNNNEIGVTLTKGYKTYLIEGSGLGLSPWANAPTCDAAEAMGYTCNITTNQAGKQVKKICTMVGTYNVCRTRTYNEDGSYTSLTCVDNSRGSCQAAGYIIGYDDNGNMTFSRYCSTVKPDGSVCTAYESAYDYTYDANGNKTATRHCDKIKADGSACSTYYSSGSYDYTYDSSGNMISQRYCSSVDSSGNCTSYSSSGSYDYTYDSSGNMISQRYCSSVDSSGNCTAYKSTLNYTYDESGNMLTRRSCSSADSNGNCTAYNPYDGYNYTYDASGNMLTELKCSSVNSSGKCTSYYANGSHTYTYDTNGNRVYDKQCGVISDEGKCTSYDISYVYTYDDNGKQIAQQYCNSFNINKSTGECNAYGYGITVGSN